MIKQQHIRSLVTGLLTLALLTGALPVIGNRARAVAATGSWADYAAATAPELSGTTYSVDTAEELAWVAKQVNSGNSFENYIIKLDTHIDVSAHDWVPIGYDISKTFKGTLDGADRKISNLQIHTAYQYVGLFGWIQGATVKNLGVDGAEINITTSTGSAHVGGLAGAVYKGRLDRCYSTGEINVTINTADTISAYTGGLVGMLLLSDMTNCFSSGNVAATGTGRGRLFVGGLTGQSEEATIWNSYATGTIKANSADDNLAFYIGGLLGANIMSSTCGNCFALEILDGTVKKASVGGFAGTNQSDSTISNCYWWTGCGSEKGVGDDRLSASTSLTGLLISQLQNKGAIGGNGTYSAAPLLDALNTEAAVLNEKSVSTESTLLPWQLTAGSDKMHPTLPITSETLLPQTRTASPTPSAVLLNGTAVAFEAYSIDGNNYFKLRDLAKALNGSAKQFEVGWDAINNAISLTSSQGYTSVGGELAISGNASSITVKPTTSSIYSNGARIDIIAYTIGNSNYFKLRDIGKAMDFGVIWDGVSNTIKIDTTTGYTE